jgi:hypothetical protein
VLVIDMVRRQAWMSGLYLHPAFESRPRKVRAVPIQYMRSDVCRVDLTGDTFQCKNIAHQCLVDVIRESALDSNGTTWGRLTTVIALQRSENLGNGALQVRSISYIDTMEVREEKGHIAVAGEQREQCSRSVIGIFEEYRMPLSVSPTGIAFEIAPGH